MAVDGVVKLINVIIDQHNDFRERKFAIGEGTAEPELWEASGTSLPDGSYAEQNPYVQAAERVRKAEDDKLITLVGSPILPVAAASDNSITFEGQVFESDKHGRRMKFLLTPGKEPNTIHPVPGPIADYYVSQKYCLGVPMSDPEWTTCKCGKLQVSQKFFAYKKGVIYTFDNESTDHEHDGSSGVTVGPCHIVSDEAEQVFNEPDGGLCTVK
ncbi:MAG: hypothetical protein KC431_19545 [Myxococcales bacterium]|nr:hypothetical protein [Myxococcales bacterium]